MKHSPGFTMLASALLLLSVACSPVLAREAAKSTQYPQATRVAPKLDLSSTKDQKNLQEGLNALNAGDTAKAEKYLQGILDNSRSKYAKAMALRGLAVVKYNAGDYPGATALIQRALANGVLPNDDYFALEYMLAVTQQADKQYQASLDTITKWRAEGKKETAESYAVQGNDEYRLGKYPEAIASIKKAQSLTDKPNPQWNEILMASYSESGQGDQLEKLAQQSLAANPNDPKVLNNAIVVLMQAKKYPEAIQLMEKARANGGLKSEAMYLNLAKLYFNQGQSSDNPKPDALKAVAVLNDGMSKGVVASNASNYLLLGEAEYLAGNVKQAKQTYDKARPLAKDGEVALQEANLLLTESDYRQARVMVKEAISKGVKRKGVAYLILAECERGLRSKSGQIAALKMAAQDPDTAERAKASLKRLGAGK